MRAVSPNLLSRIVWFGTWLLVWAAFVSLPTRILGFRDWRLVPIGTVALAVIMRIAASNGASEWAKRLGAALSARSVRWAVLPVAVGLALRIAWLVAVPTTPTSDSDEYLGLATRLAASGEYASLVPAPPHSGNLAKWYAYRPPGYPFFLATLFQLFGSRAMVGFVANLALFLLTAPLLYRVVGLLVGRPAAVLAVWLLALWPGHIAFTGLLAYEPLFLLLILLSMRFLIASQRGGLGPMAAAGFVTGLAAMVRPTALALPPVWFAFHLLVASENGRHLREVLWPAVRAASMRCAAGIAMLMVVVLPWTLRNYSHGIPVLVSSNGNSALYLVANPGATVEYNEDLPSRLIGEVGYRELAFHEESGKRAKAWIRENPWKFAAMGIERQVLLLGDDGDGFYWSLKIGKGMGGTKTYFAVQMIGHLWWTALWSLAAFGLVRGKTLFLTTPAIQALAAATLIFWLTGLPFCQASRYHMVFLPALLTMGAMALRPESKLGVVERPRPWTARRAA